MIAGTWPLWVAAVLAGAALVLLHRLATGVEALTEQVKQLRSELTDAMLPSDAKGPRDSNVARTLDELYQVGAMLEEMRNHQIDGPFRPSQPP